MLGKSRETKYRLAIKDMCHGCKYTVPKLVDTELSQRFKGIIRTHSKESEILLARLTKRKHPMIFSFCKLLMEAML